VALSNWRNDENPIHHTDTQLSEKLRSSMSSIFEENEEKLRKLKDMKTLTDLYKTTREYKQQVKEEGILSLITNKITEELLDQIEPHYTSSIIKNIQIQAQFKEEKGTVEVNSKIDLHASLKPYVEFTIEINGEKSFLIRFTFQIETSAHITKLKFTKNADEGKSIHIEKIGINIELFLLQIEFSDLDTSSSDISLDKKRKLGSKSFEIQDLSLYTDSPAKGPSNIAQTKNNETANNNEEDPLLIIDQRLARGDITIEEYETLRQALKR
jgi:hypothetical protein